MKNSKTLTVNLKNNAGKVEMAVPVHLTTNLGLAETMDLSRAATLLVGYCIGSSLAGPNFKEMVQFKPIRWVGCKAHVRAIGKTCVLDFEKALPTLMAEAEAFVKAYELVPRNHVNRKALVNQAFKLAMDSVGRLPLRWKGVTRTLALPAWLQTPKLNLQRQP